jgi:hypothetical protein
VLTAIGLLDMDCAGGCETYMMELVGEAVARGDRGRYFLHEAV